jgi:hypothetical protein
VVRSNNERAAIRHLVNLTGCVSRVEVKHQSSSVEVLFEAPRETPKVSLLENQPQLSVAACHQTSINLGPLVRVCDARLLVFHCRSVAAILGC